MPSRKAGREENVIKAFRSREAWSAWLEKYHATSSGIWMRIGRKSADVASVSYAEALEVSLCYGWIDGRRKSHDDTTWLQMFTPRTDRSIWSKVNREKAEALIRSGQMKPAGLSAITKAQQNGRWESAYDSPSRATIANDFQAALDSNPRAKAFFATLNGQNRYAILHRIQTAKKAETRARRIAQFTEMLARHEKIYP